MKFVVYLSPSHTNLQYNYISLTQVKPKELQEHPHKCLPFGCLGMPQWFICIQNCSHCCPFLSFDIGLYHLWVFFHQTSPIVTALKSVLMLLSWDTGLCAHITSSSPCGISCFYCSRLWPSPAVVPGCVVGAQVFVVFFWWIELQQTP